MTNKAIAEHLGISTALLREWKWALKHAPRLTPLNPSDLGDLALYQNLVAQMGYVKSRNYLKMEF